MNTATRNLAIRQGLLPESKSFRVLAREIVERAYAHLTRKPNSLYDQRKGKAEPFYPRHVADYKREIAKGANKDVLLDGHEAVALEVEADEPSSIPGRAFLTLDEAYQSELAAECEANLMQYVASRTKSLPDLERAYSATLTEIRTLKQLARAQMREINNRRLLSRQVPHRGHAS